MNNRQAINKLIWANAISGFAQGISMIAIPQYFIYVLHEKSGYNQLFLWVTLLTLIWGPYAGSLVDRYERKWLFFGLNITGALILLSAAATGFAGGVVSVEMTALVFVFTMLNYNLHYPALYAFTHELISGKDYARVNSKLEVQSQVTSMLSGAAAAVVISGIQSGGIVYMAPWPLHVIFMVDGFTYIAAACIIYSIRYTPVQHDEVDRSPVVERLKKGWVFLMQNKSILVFGLCSYVVFATLIVFGYYIMQVYAYEKLLVGAMVVAVSEVCYTVGAVFSGYFTQRILRYASKPGLILIYMAITVLLLTALVLFPNVWVFMVASALYGLTNSGIRIARVTWMFERVPNRMLGRSGSVFNNFNIVFRLFFIFMSGMAFIEQDISWALLMLAVSILLAMLPLLIYRKKFL